MITEIYDGTEKQPTLYLRLVCIQSTVNLQAVRADGSVIADLGFFSVNGSFKLYPVEDARELMDAGLRFDSMGHMVVEDA